MHAILDVSRLLFSAIRAAPSGIDRVELAYVRRWLGLPAAHGTFVAQSPWGWFAAVSRDRVADLVDALDRAWEDGADASDAGRRRWAALGGTAARLAFGTGRAALRDTLQRHRRPVFLLVSHRALDHDRPIAALRAAGAAFVPLIHDLIPVTHPEYARPAQAARHLKRLATTAGLADGVIVNSAATAANLLPRLAERGAAPPFAIAPLGVAPAPVTVAPPADHPYFVCLGTIEPRKNHLLLLQLWRDFATRLGADAPRLVLAGRRGWENENILDLLDRCPALRGLVREIPSAGDAAIRSLLAGSRALLFPSFAEGYGLPLAEALALGVPALCSDLPALREVGGAVPDYLDPLDGAAWRAAVLDYADPGSRARVAQCARMRSWRAPSWDAHFAAADPLLEQVAGSPVRAGAALRLPLRPEQTPPASLAAGATAA